MLEIIKPGPQLSIQDLGRFGYRHLGISQSGAIDSDAMRIANMLVSNEETVPVLEITLGMAQFKFHKATIFALCGADMSANLDAKRIDTGWCYQAQAGQTLTFATSAKSLRCYMSIHGGVDCPLTLGSASTDIMAQLGGCHGQLLSAGDTLNYAHCDTPVTQWGAQTPVREGPIHFVVDPRVQGLTEPQQAQFCAQQWQVSAQSNRMGLRLTSGAPADSLQHDLSIRTTAVRPGTIQLPPSGDPIVLLNDCQTTGGYPILGQVIKGDLPRLGQKRGGDMMQFKAVTIEQARNLNYQHQGQLNRLRIATDYN